MLGPGIFSSMKDDVDFSLYEFKETTFSSKGSFILMRTFYRRFTNSYTSFLSQPLLFLFYYCMSIPGAHFQVSPPVWFNLSI